MGAKLFRALYNDDDILMNAVKKLREEKIHIEEVYTPFPSSRFGQSHGLGRNPYFDRSFYVRLCGIDYGGGHDELYHDSRLASGHRG